MSLHPGKQVSASLRLRSMLGRGAMGSVWLADHLTLQSQVAVKFMAPAMAEDPTSVQRFRQEAKAAAEIRSPHVAQVFDHGQTADGQLFIVMELLEGESLEKRVRSAGALRPRETARIIAQVCKALAKAHERGIVHRDIKPSNVFVIDSGDGDAFVKLLDFGVAKFSGEEAVNMTAAGNMVGTPAFMSPEQLFHGKDIDYRGDLWSVGVVAYFALTGVRPFQGKTLGELAVQIKGAQFRMPTEIRNDLPPDVDAWFARALHPDIDSRFTTAKEMAQLLEHACGLSTMMTSTPSGVASQLQTFPGTTLSSDAIVVPPQRDRRVPIVAAVVAGMAIIAGGAGFLLVSGAPTRGPATETRGRDVSPGAETVSPPVSDDDPADETQPDPIEDIDEAPGSSTEASGSATEASAAAEPSTAPSAQAAPRVPRGIPPRTHSPAPKGTTKPPQDDRMKSAADKLGI